MAQWWRTPPGSLLTGLAVLVAVLLAYSASTLGGAFGTGLLALLAALVVAAAWLVRTITCAALTRRFFVRMLAVPLVFALTVGLLAFDVPVRVRFALARPAFEQAVAAIQAGAPPEDFRRRHGTYPVDQVVRRGRNIYFSVAGAGFLGGAGFAYLPAGPPDPPDRFGESHTVTPMDAPWYRFSYSL
ncbi:hypothetical protein JRC04_11950 [Mycolicibacterium sp. S2-37]|uniref:hypothetical protein n=1 Tax=Mycolicibacterium sp. S2-37 TaxID=2810297 RepID=UPI001A9443BF|nr:hypothetical protein [Mycolicibacterium sp. S2-37]MBO0678175.1 hypothetical protein [Mycolicibacterium sp. S2-37]